MRISQFCNFASILIPTFLSTLTCTQADDVPNPYKSTEYKLCTSQICEEAGNEIIRSLNESVNPCDNFYQHACGNWRANYLKPAMQSDPRSQREAFYSKLELQQRDLLEEMLEKNEIENETLRKVRDFYRSCKNRGAILVEGLSALKPMVSANGGWPLAMPPSSWSLEGQNLTLQKIHDNYVKVPGTSTLFSFSITRDRFAGVKTLTWLPSYVLPLIFFITVAKNVAKKFAEMEGFNVSFDDIKDDVEKMVTFEMALNQAYEPPFEGFFEQVLTVAELQDAWNVAVAGRPDLVFDWLEMIRGEFEGTGIVIDASQNIKLPRPRIVERLANLLKKTPLRTVVNYIHWHAINTLVSYSETHEKSDEEWSFFCTTDHKMERGLFYAYVRKYFNDYSALTHVRDMVSHIKMEMKGLFEQSTWMDYELKLKSQEKVDSMINHLGYPLWFNEPGKIDEYYSRLEIGTSYIENVKNSKRFRRTELLKESWEPDDRCKAKWPRRVIIRLEHFYDRFENTISVPVVYFQTPFFNAKRPWVMNYGSLGVLIGREVSRALDKTGIYHDNDGNFNKQWLSQLTIAKYYEKAKCLVDQYNNYTITDKRFGQRTQIFSKETLGENFVDHTGFKIALKAYRAYKEEYNLEDIRIPAIQDYTDEKLFFYSLSNTFCALPFNPRYYWLEMEAPSEIRLNVALLNMPEFSEAFNCPIGSPMNPEKKCNFWF